MQTAPSEVADLQPKRPTSSVWAEASDPGELMRTCANCGSIVEERRCKLICHDCGYFLSCSDYYQADHDEGPDMMPGPSSVQRSSSGGRSPRP